MAIESATDLSYYLSDNDFGVIANFTSPALGNVYGIFDTETQLIDGGTVQFEQQQPEFICRTSDVSDVIEGSTVTISSVDYSVKNVQGDGAGMTSLTLFSI